MPTKPTNWSLEFTSKAEKAFSQLSPAVKKKIENFIDEKLLKTSHPRRLGLALSGMQGIWRYRVGDYRLICEIQDHRLTIIAIHIGHRPDVYKKIHLVKS